MFNPTKDKYYAMILMNMDAKKYTLSNYYYSMIKVILGFMPFTILFGSMSGVPLLICLIMPIFVVMIKMIFSIYVLWDFKHNGRARNENVPSKIMWSSIIILVLIAYGLPFIGIAINSTMFYIIFAISFIGGIFSFIYINKFNDYKRLYKEILTPNNVYAVENQKNATTIQNNTLKQIELDNSLTSNKNGFAYFHELFVKRHRRILTKSARKTAIISLLIIAIVIIVTQINVDFKEKTNEIMLIYLPYFVFIMYMINRGTVVTQAMFMNCDHSMLTYRFYRTPKVILALFKERLKTLIGINLIPALVIAIGLPLILFITGGTDNPLNYLVLFVSIIAIAPKTFKLRI